MNPRELPLRLETLLLGILLTTATVASGARLPATAPETAELERVASPDGTLEIFYYMEAGQAARFGVTTPEGEILWEKIAGFRPIVTFGWADDESRVAYVTDCIQTESELPSRNPDTRSYFYVLDAKSGAIQAHGDLDTEVLDLETRLPEAKGAAHMLEVSIQDGKLHATMTHRDQQVEGSRSLEDLAATTADGPGSPGTGSAPLAGSDTAP